MHGITNLALLFLAALEVSIEDLRNKNETAWRQLLQELGPGLLGYATRMVKNSSDAEEVVQECLISAIKNLEGFEGRASLKSWLYTIVRNRSIDLIRKNKRYIEQNNVDPEADYFNENGRWKNGCPKAAGEMESQLDVKWLLERVNGQLALLPHEQRDLILLKDVEQLDTPEICSILGISPGNMRIRLHRARQALRAAVVHLEAE